IGKRAGSSRVAAGRGVGVGGGPAPPPEEGGGPPARGGGGARDPHPIPPLFKGREEIAARSQPDTVAFNMIAPSAAEQPRVLRLVALAREVGAERRGPHVLEPGDERAARGRRDQGLERGDHPLP